MSTEKTGLELLREPFPAHQIGKLSKETKAQKAEREKDSAKGMKCALCGAWHHRNAVHLDYVGHAALTDRLLDVDPGWHWEPLAYDEHGLPKFDSGGGLWIRLHVLGINRLGYGNAADSDYKDVGSREKEVIGDALRNAAMRFGAALELWHKGILHVDEDTGEIGKQAVTPGAGAEEGLTQEERSEVERLASAVYAALLVKNNDLAFSNYKAAFEFLVSAEAQAAFTGKFSSEQRTIWKKMRKAELEKQKEEQVSMLTKRAQETAMLGGQG